jgi:hypothetical protein
MAVQQPISDDQELNTEMPMKYRTRLSIDEVDIQVQIPHRNPDIDYSDDIDYPRLRYTDKTKNGDTQTIDKPLHRFTAIAEYGTDTVNKPNTHVHHKNRVKLLNSRDNLMPIDGNTHTEIHNHGSRKRLFLSSSPDAEYCDIGFKHSDYWVNPDAPEPVLYENTDSELREFCLDYITQTPISLEHLSDRWGPSVGIDDIFEAVSWDMNNLDADIQHLFNDVYGPCDLSLSQLDAYDTPTPKTDNNAVKNHISPAKYGLLTIRDNGIVSLTELDRDLPHHDRQHIRTTLDKFACAGIIDYHPHTDTYTDPDADTSLRARLHTRLSEHIPIL